MPHWWTCNTWQLQFPLDKEPVCSVNLAQFKSTNNPNNFFWYCPLWSAPNKAGRPKKGERRKSGIKTPMNKKREVKRHKLRLYCQICGKHNHTSKDCWKDPINAQIGIGADEFVGDNGDDSLVGCA